MTPLLVVLDLDSTLLYACEKQLDREPDLKVEGYSVYRRPGLEPFLAGLFAECRVAVWTSSGKQYAQGIVDGVFQDRREKLEFVWSVERCTRKYDPEFQEHYWVKNFKKVKQAGYDLSRTVVVDDTPRKHELNYGNLIRVSEYLGGSEDSELLLLLRYLKLLSTESNVRKVEKRGWRTRSDLKDT